MSKGILKNPMPDGVMAIYTGDLPLRGKVGGLVFYQVGNQTRVRTVTSVDAKRIRRDPAFNLVRRNNREFGGASVAGATVRLGMRELLKAAPDGRLASHLTRLCGQLKGEGEFGRRHILLGEQAERLVGLQGPGAPLNVEWDADRELLHVVHDGAVPVGATHTRAVIRFFTVCDHVYDDCRKGYQPLHSQRGATVYSDLTPVMAGSKKVVAPHVWALKPEWLCAAQGEAVVCAVMIEFVRCSPEAEHVVMERTWVVAGVRVHDDGGVIAHELLVAEERADAQQGPCEAVGKNDVDVVGALEGAESASSRGVGTFHGLCAGDVSFSSLQKRYSSG